MSDNPVYFDNAATTRPDPAVVEAVRESLEERWGNPSSIHELGTRARRKIDEARVAVAKLAGCQDDEVYFSSGGTEADNWSILGALDYWRGKKSHFITVATEHHAVLDTAQWCRARGHDVTILPVDAEGRLNPDDVRQAIRNDTALVSVMHVNNELGTIQDIPAIGAICRERRVTFHTDAVQSLGKIPFEFPELNADLMSVSAHKIYGPKGIGALIIRRGTRISPRFIGGSQERGLRTGTENSPGIVGFGKAAEICGLVFDGEMRDLRTMRDQLENRIVGAIPDVKLNGSREHRHPGILNISFLGCEGEALLIALDRRGFCVSTGSACSAGAVGASHVLMALGMDVMDAQAAIRFSFGRFNNLEDVEALMSVLPAMVAKQRETSTMMAR
jgi:cysteine desulfurase